jgi:PPM family protein phosphatase
VCGAARTGPSPTVAGPGDGWPSAPAWSAAAAGLGGPEMRVDRWAAGPIPGQSLCAGCGEPTGTDGWCNRCPPPWSPARDHLEVVDGPVAAVSDLGSTHWRNEDAVGVRWVDGNPGGFALVVCDGVSVSQDPHLVSQVAVDTALQVLWEAVATGGDLGAAMVAATAAAQRAAAAVPYDPSLDVGPGACTFVAAAVRGSLAGFASVGDSRAYWVDASGAVQIGRDDSLAAELIASGRFTTSQAMRRADAHALTRWLGVDSTGAGPSVTVVELPGPGLVVLASDGLWNYAPTPAAMASLIGPVGAETTIALARRLAGFANASGGADNITVAVGPHGIDRQEGR